MQIKKGRLIIAAMNPMTPSDDSITIDLLGGTNAVARLCKIKQPSVSEWRVNGIPQARRQFLELIRPDAFSPKAIASARQTRAANDKDEGEAAEADGNPVPPVTRA